MSKELNFQIPLDFFPVSDPTLDSFIVGDNSHAFAEVEALSKGEGMQFVYLFGEQGTGKTHLLKAIAGNVVSGAVPHFDPDVRLYAVDDVHKLTDKGLERLFELANLIRANPSCSLLMSGNKSPAALKAGGMRVDVASRLAWGAVFELKPLSAEQKRDAFRSKAHSRGMNVPEEVMTWIETYLPRDMSTLNRIFEGVEEYSRSKNRNLTIPLIKEWLEEAEVENQAQLSLNLEVDAGRGH